MIPHFGKEIDEDVYCELFKKNAETYNKLFRIVKQKFFPDANGIEYYSAQELKFLEDITHTLIWQTNHNYEDLHKKEEHTLECFNLGGK